MQPELKKAAEDTEKKVIEVTAEKLETDKIAEVVGKDEAVAKKVYKYKLYLLYIN